MTLLAPTRTSTVASRIITDKLVRDASLTALLLTTALELSKVSQTACKLMMGTIKGFLEAVYLLLVASVACLVLTRARCDRIKGSTEVLYLVRLGIVFPCVKHDLEKRDSLEQVL